MSIMTRATSLLLTDPPNRQSLATAQRFIEDALALKADARVAWFKVDATNMESIHNHAAFARIAWERPKAP